MTLLNSTPPPLQGSQRRRFLKFGAAGAAGVAVLAAVERLMPPSDVPDAAARRMRGGPLSALEFRTLELMAAAVIGAPAGALGTHDTRTAERIELELTRNQGALLSDVQIALKLVEYLPLLWGFGARFSRLDDAARLGMLQRMNDSDNDLVRSAFKGLRFFCLLFYYTDERAWKRMGYGGPWMPAKFYVGGNRIANLRPEATAGGAK